MHARAAGTRIGPFELMEELAVLLATRAERLLSHEPARAWRELKDAIAHARGVAAFLEASRAEHEQLSAQPPQDGAGARRLTLFVVTRLGCSRA